MKRKLLTLLLAASMAVLATGCTLDDFLGDDSSAHSDDTSLRSSVNMSLGDDGSLQIERLSRETTASMGDDGTWTIFVYLCGTDLESEDGMAASDMEEMQSASTDDNVRFVVETGGTYSWTNGVDSDKLQRYVISGGDIELADEAELANMGESSTLADFLSWGVGNYAADNMGVVLWNHGGGSVSGVCFDETNDNDSLSLREIDAAFLSVYDSMTENFEFIGFDACLMGAVECANVAASYANYMYGSEETESGYGWDYKSIGEYLTKNPTADGAALGKVVADSLYESCDEIGEGDATTFSIIDLSKTDALITVFNTFSNNLYTATEDETALATVVRAVLSADNFGGNNASEGYTNMVDLAGIVNAGADYADGAAETLAAIADAVVYVKNGSDHEDACGLATYYPLQIQGTEELKTFGEIAVSPYYLSFVDRAAYSAANEGDYESYDNTETIDFWGFFEYSEDDDGNYSDTEDYYEDYADEDYWSYYDSYEQTGESSLITFENEPALDSDGSYGFTLTEEALNQTASVQASVYMLSDDEQDLIDLGISVDILADWETGEFSDNFDGSWFSLPDGQILAVYMVSENDGYDIYTSPVLLNGEETNLRITHNYELGEITIDGAWDGIDENGMAGRDITKLSEGDEITPLYSAFDIDSEDEYTYYGETYTFDGTPEIIYSYLPNGDFYYGFSIDDVYGDYYMTDYVAFSVEGEDVYYYTD